MHAVEDISGLNVVKTRALEVIKDMVVVNRETAEALNKALVNEDSVQYFCWSDGTFVEAEEFLRNPDEWAWVSDDYTVVNIPEHLVGTEIAENILCAQ